MIFQTLVLLTLLFQAGSESRQTIVIKPAQEPQRNIRTVYFDNSFLFVARHYGSSQDEGGNTEPGLFVYSKRHAKWIQILQISTAGGRFGKSWSDNREDMKKMQYASVSWDFTGYAKLPYIDQPLHTSGSIIFPGRVRYDSSAHRYELRYLSEWGVPSAETVLYINRKDLVEAFTNPR